MIDIFSKLEELKKLNKSFTLCIITETKGSTPRKAGSRMIVTSTRELYGTIGGGSIEKQVIDEAFELLSQDKPVVKRYQLEEDLGMQCGGEMTVYMEPFHQSPKLYIFGAGHVGRAVAKLATEFGFRITIFDQRKEIFDSINLPGATFISKDYFEAILETDFDRNTYIVVTTPQHTYDEQITGIVAAKPHAYVGMIGSKKKVAYLKTRFLENHVLTQDQIEDIDMPIGIPFAVETPEEIAVSIIAKLIDVKNTVKNEPS